MREALMKFQLMCLTLHLLLQKVEKSECAALRNNIIIVLADFCVRYTALVDW